jgi:uncharacterized membrane protein YccC
VRVGRLAEITPPEWLTPPDWLVALVKPKAAAIPWPAAARAAVALGLPLAICWAVDRLPLGLFIAMGAMSGAVGDRRGPYRVRALQIGLSAFFGALGLLIGGAVFGHGVITFFVLCAVALFTAIASVAGTIASTASLQALIFTIVASSRAFPPPAWQPPVLYLAGGLWAMSLTLLGTFRDSVSAERRAVATAITALADLADAIGTAEAEQVEAKRRAVTDALNAAYDALLAGRVRSGGRHPAFRRFMGLLNACTPLLESTVAAMRAGRRPPEHVAPALREVANALLTRTAVPELPDWGARPPAGDTESGAVEYPHPTVRERIRGSIDQVLSGPATWTFALRLTICIGAAELLRQIVPTGRSYWMVLTVAIVLKADFGSVFARAVQRAGGTLVGAAIGAGLLAWVPRGIGDVIAIAVLAALLPIAIVRQYGMFSTFITPLVILLIDLLSPNRWETLDDRLIDTAIGCGVVLVFGYLLWPETFRSRIGPRFVDAVEDLADYTNAALHPDGTDRGALRRSTYRRLSDLRTVFQQALAEPPPVSRRASAWWPGIVALERLTDAVTRAAIRLDHGAPPPPEDGVAALADGISDLAGALAERRPPRDLTLPDDPMLEDIATELRTARKVMTGPAS